MGQGIGRWYSENKLEGIVIIYVDDFIFTGSVNFMDLILAKVVSEYEIGTQKTNAFKYIGLKLEKSDQGILLAQDEYAH